MNQFELPPFSLSAPHDNQEIIKIVPQDALDSLSNAVAGFIGQSVAYLILPKK